VASSLPPGNLAGPEPGAGWRFWIDRGGTFTDLVGRSPKGRLVVRKLLSQSPVAGDPAIRALRQVIGLAEAEPLPPGLVREVRLGTTVATNALLEHGAEPVLLLLNRGFADLPVIGDQHRPELFALEIERPEPLAMRVLEVEGRLGADGRELEPLRRDPLLERQLRQALADGYRSCAVALMHAYRQPAHERELGAWLEQLGFPTVVLSHQVSRQPRLVPRLATTAVEAAIRPMLQRYLHQVRQALGPTTTLRVMTSSGALQDPAQLQAKDTILSGPAGGMVGAVAAAQAAGFTQGPILGFDMGGTSTDVFHVEAALGEQAWDCNNETEIAGLRLQAQRLPIHTVAAGGGSVLQVEDGRLLVGPRSAGADPGPACYGRGGPLTVTDANLLLGRLPVVALPALFGPGGDQPADAGAVRQGFEHLAEALADELPLELPFETLAQGALTIAVERMAEAIRRISIQRGHDIRSAVLVAFGGAGGQHACALAASLGIERVLLHPLAGVLSAWGIGLARQRQQRERTLGQPLSLELLQQLPSRIAALVAEAEAALLLSGDRSEGGAFTVQVRLELRYPGRDQGLELPLGEEPVLAEVDLRRLLSDFEVRHRQRYGYVVPGEPLVLERLLVDVTAGEAMGTGGEMVAEAAAQALPAPERNKAEGTWSEARVPLCLPAADGRGMVWHAVPLWRREWLVPDQRLEGPALVLEATGTIVLEPHWSALVLPGGEMLLERRHSTAAATVVEAGMASTSEASGRPDPVRLELYNHRFSAIAEQMGVRLQQSSRSVNIRERLDFSCALFDAAGRLVANAPHIPVHLGSMGESVVSLLAAVASGERPAPLPGDALASNNPFNGGTHLPDITVITPVFAKKPAGSSPIAYVACRGHHADVGGITPGSMPPFSHRIEDEGLLLDNVPLIRHGAFDREGWRQRLLAGRHPVRNPDQLLADLQAQVAANQLGVGELQRLIQREGPDEVTAYMAHVQSNAAEAVRRVIERLQDGSHAVELDQGARIRVAVRIDRSARRATVDFSGTSPQQEGNLNAPLAITKSVVLYVFRTLVGQPIPLNAGCFEPIDLVVPPGCLLRPSAPAAVVAGNVETSQAVANALFAALGVMAAAQGTMNNLSFGNDRCQYYETICGGTGAGRLLSGEGFAGASAVQSHMTNSRLTDPEILEDRFPVRLERFFIRRGSGGKGRWPGGNGVRRELRFLEPMTVAILSGSRRLPPFGLAGGGPGKVGRNWLQRVDAGLEELPGCAELQLDGGDLLGIETPGGGGYGVAQQPEDPRLEPPGAVAGTG
jgi:5-oxoprolinase (ATP-hydrolysing)